MDTDNEIRALAAENLALSIIVGQVFSNLAKDKSARLAIAQGFDQAADVAQTIAIQFGKTASPDHTVKALRIIEEMRTVVLGESKPIG